MKCQKCNKDLVDGSVFCNFCGAKQEKDAELTMKQMIANIQELVSITGFSYNEAGELTCEQWIKEFGYEIVCDSVKTALSQYLIKDNNGGYTKDSVDEVFSKIGGIIKNKHTAISKPYITDVRRITNYAGKAFRFNYYELQDLSTDLNNILYYFFTSDQYGGKVEDILAMVRGSHDKYEFLEKIEELKNSFNIR